MPLPALLLLSPLDAVVAAVVLSLLLRLMLPCSAISLPMLLV
ncbi:hypothetical protein BVRB_5g109230 [Beta vulgaris subsp. vulgaris]|nr:hypothetical protein BVRB_5g109230 [Beta vulgaris subsp. vulgaris]